MSPTQLTANPAINEIYVLYFVPNYELNLLIIIIQNGQTHFKNLGAYF